MRPLFGFANVMSRFVIKKNLLIAARKIILC